MCVELLCDHNWRNLLSVLMQYTCNKVSDSHIGNISLCQGSGTYCLLYLTGPGHRILSHDSHFRLQYSVAQHCNNATHLDDNNFTLVSAVIDITSITDKMVVTDVTYVSLLYQVSSGLSFLLGFLL